MYLYELVLIPPDLQHEETIATTANCFEYLTKVINEVFDKIDARIEKNNALIQSLHDRTTTVKNKIDSLVGINKAIKIFSPVKYPGSIVNENVEATFSLENRASITLNMDFKIQSKPGSMAHRSMDEKLQFYHVNKILKQCPTNKLSSNVPRMFPYYTESINNLLLFNESKIMFGKSSNSLAKSLVQRSDGKSIERLKSGSNINSIPLPVLNRNLNTKKINENLFYTPNITKAPELDMPNYLPDLPGIADDIRFNVSNIDDLLIVPNQVIEKPCNLPEVPLVSYKEPELSHNQLTIIAPSVHVKTRSPTNLEPPNIERSGMMKSASISLDQQKPIKQLPPPIPPPPPPPPPTVSTKTTEREIVKSEPLPISKFGEENLHSTLMNAIRQAGGIGKAKLRAASLASEKEKPKSSPTSGDLMADLHKKLAMRRKGISGSNLDSKSNLMDSISSMIPAPPKPDMSNESTGHTDNDSDWE